MGADVSRTNEQSMGIKGGVGERVTAQPVSPSVKAAPTAGGVTVPGVPHTPTLWCVRLSGRNGGEVLLTDGTFTDPGNCMMREFGVVLHKPEWFGTRAAAARYVTTNYGVSGRCVAALYTWDREPWEREGSIQKTAVDLGHDWYYGPRSDNRVRS